MGLFGGWFSFFAASFTLLLRSAPLEIPRDSVRGSPCLRRTLKKEVVWGFTEGSSLIAGNCPRGKLKILETPVRC